MNELQKQIHDLQCQIAALKNTGAAKCLKLSNLSKQEKLDRIFEIPQLSESLYLLLADEGFPTGSDIYSNANPTDYDWCVPVPPAVFEGYAIGTEAGYWIEDGMVPLYAHYNGNILNILCMSDYDMFQAWYKATEIMRALKSITIAAHRLPGQAVKYTKPLVNVFDSKWARVAVFRALKEVCWPVKEQSTQLKHEDAIEHHKCVNCHRTAEFFTDRAHREQWKSTGICERCEPNLAISPKQGWDDDYYR